MLKVAKLFLVGNKKVKKVKVVKNNSRLASGFIEFCCALKALRNVKLQKKKCSRWVVQTTVKRFNETGSCEN